MPEDLSGIDAMKYRDMRRPTQGTIGSKSFAWAVLGLPQSGSPALCVRQAARRMRRRRRWKLVRPYIWRLISLRRVIWPSAWPLLQGAVSAVRSAARPGRREGFRADVTKMVV